MKSEETEEREKRHVVKGASRGPVQTLKMTPQMVVPVLVARGAVMPLRDSSALLWGRRGERV